MNFEAVIGLEMHIELKTKSKMFSTAPVSFGAPSNYNVAPLDMAMPGALPSVNKKAVQFALEVAKALNMKIDNELIFDRKNYFYSDLSKGYQITQEYRPLGKDGYLDIYNDNSFKRIEIERLHIEEDTCKQVHYDNYTLLDYNRSGIPLIEIVTRPTIRSGSDASKFVDMIKKIVTYLGVSDGKMEEGSLRCDVNISVRPYGCNKLNTKVEIKNLNSITNIKKAIDYEYSRQVKMLLTNQKILPETRRFDEVNKVTVPMRIKIEQIDYKCFREPNIPTIYLSDEFINSSLTNIKLPNIKLAKYINEFNLSNLEAEAIIENKEVSLYFDKLCEKYKNYSLIKNYFLTEVFGYLNKNNISINEFNISSDELVKLIIKLDKKEISHSQSKEIFNKMANENINFENAIKILNISSQIRDVNIIRVKVNEVLDKNQDAIKDFKDGKARAFGYIMGCIIKESNGKFNASIINEVLKEELLKR